MFLLITYHFDPMEACFDLTDRWRIKKCFGLTCFHGHSSEESLSHVPSKFDFVLFCIVCFWVVRFWVVLWLRSILLNNNKLSIITELINQLINLIINIIIK